MGKRVINCIIVIIMVFLLLGIALAATSSKVSRLLPVVELGKNRIELSKLEQDSTGIDELTFKSSKYEKKVKIIIERMPKNPEADPTTDVYSYFKLDKTKLTDKEIWESSIIFAVNKSWVRDNGYDKEEVMLYRFDEGWKPLEIAFVKETAMLYYYQAVSPGFSLFAVTAEKEEVEEVVVEEEVAPDQPIEVSEAEEVEHRSFLDMLVIALYIILGLIVLAAIIRITWVYTVAGPVAAAIALKSQLGILSMLELATVIFGIVIVIMGLAAAIVLLWPWSLVGIVVIVGAISVSIAEAKRHGFI
ncbi:MAG: PGF-pre-PGF domain-containing protein [Candidatus Woesearchaeota archaeon]